MVCSGRVWCVVDLFVMLCCLTDLGACVVGLVQFCLCLASWIVLARVFDGVSLHGLHFTFAVGGFGWVLLFALLVVVVLFNSVAYSDF